MLRDHQGKPFFTLRETIINVITALALGIVLTLGWLFVFDCMEVMPAVSDILNSIEELDNHFKQR
jgi:hypothetical protein